MIISASYKTDIPAFYGEWFMNRLRAGFCKMVNPYNQQVIRVDLTRPAVDGIVFWTKNAGPFIHHFDTVADMGYPFVVQYTINAYPRSLEFSVVDAHKSVEHMHTLCKRFGPRVAVWRYDTILFTSLTPMAFHRRNFARLAQALEGATDEVIISFAQIYRKTRRNLDWAARKFGFQWEDPADPVKYELAGELAEIARQHGMRISMCAQRAYLAPGVEEAHCIDAQRLAEVAGKPIAAPIKGNRPECMCYQSRDIGEYDTCPHGCVYCYAVRDRRLAQRRYRLHDPEGAFLFPPREGSG
ncbi:MAG: DUF1848 domain-containing protein [Caldilineae bacterium]|nr:MAG: DUF1848 domain-containing protein [Caldilineae bacterium]